MPISEFSSYKYFIGKGNNSGIVKAALKTRFWWTFSDR